MSKTAVEWVERLRASARQEGEWWWVKLTPIEAEEVAGQMERLVWAAEAAIAHWNEFGPEYGFDECMHMLDAAICKDRGGGDVPAAAPEQISDGETVASSIDAILYQCDRGNVSLPWLIDAVRGLRLLAEQGGGDA